MPATLVRGEDEFGNFDLQPRPKEDLGTEEATRHAASQAIFIENFSERNGIFLIKSLSAPPMAEKQPFTTKSRGFASELDPA